jgi:hypothetical protein
MNAKIKESIGQYFLTSTVYGFQIFSMRYEKNPNKITEAEFNQLVSKFNKSLGQFGEI